MSKLDELIKEYCPEGVEYKKLCEITEYNKVRVDASTVNEKTYIGVDNLLPNKQGKTDSSYVPNEGSLIQFYSGDILIGNIRPYLKKIWLAEYNGATNGDVLPVHITASGIDHKYLYYCLSSDQFFLYDMQHAKGAKMPRGDKTAIMEYKIPVPPIEVQREIVRILDSFTKLTADLTERLTAELTARKAQHEYYRDKLLSFDEIGGVARRVKLGEIATVFRGEYITKKESVEGNIPVILGGQEPAYFINRANHKGEVVVIARSGASAGFVSYWNEPIFITDGFGFEAKRDIAIPKYLYYSLKRKEKALNGMKRGAGVPHVSGEMLSQVELPIPPLHVQERIVSVLDNFDAICSDLNIGLPAEIEARQKQYEYYRDMLLTFAETGAIISQTDRQTDRAE